MQWLDENEDVSMEFLYGALGRDKKDGVSLNHFRLLMSGFIHTVRFQTNGNC